MAFLLSYLKKMNKFHSTDFKDVARKSLLILIVFWTLCHINCEITSNSTIPDKSIPANANNTTNSNNTITNDIKSNVSTSTVPNELDHLNVTSQSADETVISDHDAAKSNSSLEATSNESKAVEQEHNNSMAIFFVLCVIALGILLIHTMLETGYYFVKEELFIKEELLINCYSYYFSQDFSICQSL